MKHRPYMLNLDMLTRMARKHGALEISKKDKSEKVLQKVATYLYHNEPQMIQTLEFMIHCEEYLWLSSGKQVYFFDSADTASALINSSYNIENIASLYEGEETFMLALPADLMIGGRKVGGGLLVNVMQHDQRAERVSDAFCKWTSQPAPTVTFDVDDVSDFGVYVSYQEHYGSHEFMRFAFPSKHVAEVLKFKTVDEYEAYNKANNKFHFLHGADLSRPETAYQFEIIRLIAGLLLYRKALPDRIKAGMPSDFKARDFDSRYIDKHKPFVLSSPATDASHSVGAHYRAWHFRQLMNERYYKGEHEGEAKGSRIVFVRDSMVNREVEAETVT